MTKLIEECDASADENTVSLVQREIEQLEKEIADFYNSYEYLDILRDYERNKEDIDTDESLFNRIRICSIVGL